MAGAFYGASNLTVAAVDAPNLTGVTSMESMFQRASAFNQDISNWNVSAVTSCSNFSEFSALADSSPPRPDFTTSTCTP